MSGNVIPAIKAGKNEEEFLVELYNEFGGNDQIGTIELQFGEEAGEEAKELMKISSRATLYGLVKFTAKWVSKTQKAAKFSDEFKGCRLAKNTSHKVKLVVDGKEITETSDFVKKVTKKAAKAAKKQAKARAKRARKARAEERDFIKYEMNDLHARMFEAQKLHSEMREIAQDLVDEYGIEFNDAMRHVINGGEISLKIYNDFSHTSINAVQLCNIELQAAEKFVFAKIHKGKIITASKLADLENIKGKLFIDVKEKTDSLIRKVNNKVNGLRRKVNIVKDRFTARLIENGFTL